MKSSITWEEVRNKIEDKSAREAFDIFREKNRDLFSKVDVLEFKKLFIRESEGTEEMKEIYYGFSYDLKKATYPHTLGIVPVLLDAIEACQGKEIVESELSNYYGKVFLERTIEGEHFLWLGDHNAGDHRMPISESTYNLLKLDINKTNI